MWSTARGRPFQNWFGGVAAVFGDLLVLLDATGCEIISHSIGKALRGVHVMASDDSQIMIY
ncbi:hypothetical protein DL239_08935 [Sedimentitalea sp. CY04]|uniref:Uncharacterized protein n=1 Tax=Parasedimentitalea denitrificans TaxID=2211118 RepID=A0ABX0W8U4_9RHOB|nr:hypothetical protein [Sedimentitalea sp. CY04]